MNIVESNKKNDDKKAERQEDMKAKVFLEPTGKSIFQITGGFPNDEEDPIPASETAYCEAGPSEQRVEAYESAYDSDSSVCSSSSGHSIKLTLEEIQSRLLQAGYSL